MPPFFSIVVPCLNAAPFLERALLSVLNQSGGEVEILVADGGSSDDTMTIVHRYANRIAWCTSETDRGQSAAMNKAFAQARGQYLLWLNADDLILPGALDAARRHLERNPKCRWLAGNLVYVDANDHVLWCARDGHWHDWLYRHAPVRVYGPTSFFRRDDFEMVGGFDETLRYAMDTDLWLRFRAHGLRFDRLPRYCWAFRVHGGSKTAGELFGDGSPAGRQELRRIAEKHRLHITHAGLWQQRIWRLVNGCYARAWWDTRRWQGVPVIQCVQS